MRTLLTAAISAAAAAGAAAIAATTVMPYGDDYARDRAMIEDLQARYMFAMDFRDPDFYAEVFTEDAILTHGNGTEVGREAIHAFLSAPPRFPAEPGLRPSKGAHNITNIVIEVDGDRARSVANWFVAGKNNPERSAGVGAYGHYEDELVKIDGQWYFSKREIYNEQLDRRSAAGQPNPVRGLWSDAATPTWTDANPQPAQ